MPTFIKPGFWEKSKKGYKDWLNLDQLITSNSNNVTNISLTNLQTLIASSGLKMGDQYYVTDKDWLLYATSTNTLKPVSGSLHIFNGQTLPTGVEPDILYIDTGIVDWDTSSETGTPLNIDVPSNYIPVEGFLESFETVSDNPFIIADSNGETLFSLSSIYSGYKYVLQAYSIGIGWSSYGSDLTSLLIDFKGNTIDGFRLILEFHRSELSFPIPVPSIVSAETDEVGDFIIVTTNNILKKQSVCTPIVKINGIIATTDEVLVGDEQHETDITCLILNIPNEGDIVTISIPANQVFNTWGGLLPEVIDYPVVNNVPPVLP